MRILFLQDHLRIGGTEKQTLALAEFGQKIGIETGLIVFRPGGALKPDAETLGFFKTLQPFNSRIDEWAPGLIGQIRAFAPDIIVFMGKVAHLYLERIRKYFPKATLVATFRSGKQRVPYYERALKLSDGIITNSQVEKKRILRGFSFDESKVKTVHNGCLIQTSAHAGKSTGSNSFRILYVAMFRPQKNQQELLSTLSHLPETIDWHCTFAGTGETLATCQAHAKKLNLQHRVTFTWASDLTSLYESHDVAVLTSDKEGLPNSLVEAQYAGLPVIAYLVNGVQECFEEGISGYGIPLGNQQAFLEALILLGTNPQKRLEMSAAAERFGRKHFNFEERCEEFFTALRHFHDSSEGSTSR